MGLLRRSLLAGVPLAAAASAAGAAPEEPSVAVGAPVAAAAREVALVESRWLLREIASDHAGETGAVAIYKGALAALALRPALREGAAAASLAASRFADDHMRAELRHLRAIDELVNAQPAAATRLLPAWRAAGFVLGFAPTLLGGPTALFVTVAAVEDFVEEHYGAQIAGLAPGEAPALKTLLETCCADEVHHRDDAASRAGACAGTETADLWSYVVRTGSAVAAECARRA